MDNQHDFADHLAQTLNWHFSQETGSEFWLSKRHQLDFNPLSDIRSFSDLALFPDVTEELKEVRIEHLIPKGLKNEKIAGVFESGGTTGRPKRIVAFQSWLDELVAWRLDYKIAHGVATEENTLAIVPTGPHIVGEINRLRARARGGQFFAVDLDPRWVKKLLRNNDMAAASAYSDHLIDQAEDIIYCQSIAYLVTTPPLLERIAKRPKLVSHLNRTLKGITWGGTQMDPDTWSFLATVVFPDVPISASYGSTMILSEAKSRQADYSGKPPVFESFAPYVLFEVVDAATGLPVAFGERGRVVMNHLSKYAFLPNILERDSAIRVPRRDMFPGAAVSHVCPVAEIAGQAVIEGVY